MFFYNVAIRLYVLLVYLAAPFHTKARKLIIGRRAFFKIHQPDRENVFVWFHCASLGEFEQARPLIEKIKEQNPDKKILLSFFSSSGYEIRKNYPLADKVIYLPFDFASNANKFLGTFQISAAIFIKYDVWPNYLQELLNRKIPLFLTSATFRNDQFYFKWYGKFLKQLLKRIDKIYVQNKESLDILERHGFENAIQCGDVRVDRVVKIRSSNEKLTDVEKFTEGKDCFVFGSVYPSEVELIHQIEKNTTWKMIIAPHNVDMDTIRFFTGEFPDSVLMSEVNTFSDQRILIVDNIGMLSKLYKYACGVYVGGGFGKTIHNILEPAVWEIPVYFGPKFHKFPEAKDFIQSGIGFSEKNPADLAKIMYSNMKDFDQERFEQVSKNWFKTNSGATMLIYNDLSDII